MLFSGGNGQRYSGLHDLDLGFRSLRPALIFARNTSISQP